MEYINITGHSHESETLSKKINITEDKHMKAKICTIDVGNSGEYFAVAEMQRRGYEVAVPMSNTPAFDILAIRKSDGVQFAIQVKTRNNGKQDFTLNKKCETIVAANIYYVFVNLNGLDHPDYYIVPSKVVADRITQYHKTWLARPGRGGKKHNDNNMRTFVIDPSDVKYKNNWDFLG